MHLNVVTFRSLADVGGRATLLNRFALLLLAPCDGILHCTSTAECSRRVRRSLLGAKQGSFLIEIELF